MMEKRLVSMLIVPAAWMAFNHAPAWSQGAPRSAQEQPTARERTGEEKMEARGAQQPGRMERQKGEEKMGAQSGNRADGPQNHAVKAWSRQDIRKAQEALKKHGHNPGSIDGIVGPQTRAAIRAFQSSSGLKQTGNLDAETAEKLAVSGK
jgi:hypothetical protein